MFDLTWYHTLTQPPLTPPAWIFSPVWIFLYISMGVSLFIFAKEPSFENKTWGYILFFTQLLTNLAWIPAFFEFKNITLAFGIIVLLDILVIFNIFEFFKTSKPAGKILIPYLIWIIFATYLNLGFLILN